MVECHQKGNEEMSDKFHFSYGEYLDELIRRRHGLPRGMPSPFDEEVSSKDTSDESDEQEEDQ